MKAAFSTGLPTTGLAASRIHPFAGTAARAGAGALARPRSPRTEPEPEPCGGQTVIDFALCLILAVVVVGLLLLAL
ncbi:MAG: hypothetical protein PGN25_10355 [Methylorubrum populi]